MILCLKVCLAANHACVLLHNPIFHILSQEPKHLSSPRHLFKLHSSKCLARSTQFHRHICHGSGREAFAINFCSQISADVLPRSFM